MSNVSYTTKMDCAEGDVSLLSCCRGVLGAICDNGAVFAVILKYVAGAKNFMVHQFLNAFVYQVGSHTLEHSNE
jgi:hypothetical protein